MVTIWVTIMFLVMVAVPLAQSEEKQLLRCYKCIGTENGPDLDNCVKPNENTTSGLCGTDEIYCKKRIVKASGETKIERRCYDSMCTDQQGIAMGQQVYIDAFCCQGDLCNHSNSLKQPLMYILLLLLALRTMF